jgi:hypothetical protein
MPQPQLSEPKARMHRPCDKCEKRFQPFGRSNRICNKCADEINKKRNNGQSRGKRI